MRPRQSLGQTRPKISTMPRPKTEASAYLDIYKLVNEQKRLQEDLAALEQRRDRILTRLALLDQQIGSLEADVQQMRSSDCAASRSAHLPSQAPPVTQSSDDFQTFLLEY